MQISLLLGRGGEPVDTMLQYAAEAAEAGLAGVWYGQHLRYESATLAVMAASHGPGILVGAGVVPAYPRHPLALASQALTVGIATGHRFRLGVGPSHRRTIEGIYGLDYAAPARYLEEYLTVLRELTTLQRTDFEGRFFRVHAELDIPEGRPMPLFTGSLGPQTLELCGRIADGNLTYLAGPRTIAEHVLPSIDKGADTAGRARPRIAAAVPVLVTDDVPAAHDRLADYLGFHTAIDVYQAVIARERVDGPAELAIVGDEATVRAGIERFRDAGVDEFAAAVFGSRSDTQRTCATLERIAEALA
ncbi:TIGR03564 family F420-dependent LLM class oxidoreductase [soil metagenome]